MLKQNLQQKLGLKINPLQIQLIKLLELPTYQLEQRIKEELESNPLLEEGEEKPEPEVDIKEDGDEVDYDDNSQEEDNYESSEDEFSLDDYISDEDDIPDYKLTASNASKDDDAREFVLSGGISFRENLVEQLGTQHLGEMDRKICEYIIGNIDDDGYLRRDVENIVDDLAFGAGIEVDDEKIESLLRVVQRFDPAGVGARDLRECLLLQVKRRLAETSTPALINARIILESYFEEFSKKHYEKISKRMRISDEELKEAVDEILKLNPKPGGQISDSSVPGAEKIIPDFNLDIVDGELQLSLNTGDIPELRLNKSYVNMLEDYQKNSNSREKKDVVSFVKYKLSSARSFIDAVQQRNNTLMLTMTAIVQFQKPFFQVFLSQAKSFIVHPQQVSALSGINMKAGKIFGEILPCVRLVCVYIGQHGLIPVITFCICLFYRSYCENCRIMHSNTVNTVCNLLPQLLVGNYQVGENHAWDVKGFCK